MKTGTAAYSPEELGDREIGENQRRISFTGRVNKVGDQAFPIEGGKAGG